MTDGPASGAGPHSGGAGVVPRNVDQAYSSHPKASRTDAPPPEGVAVDQLGLLKAAVSGESKASFAQG